MKINIRAPSFIPYILATFPAFLAVTARAAPVDCELNNIALARAALRDACGGRAGASADPAALALWNGGQRLAGKPVRAMSHGTLENSLQWSPPLEAAGVGFTNGGQPGVRLTGRKL